MGSSAPLRRAALIAGVLALTTMAAYTAGCASDRETEPSGTPEPTRTTAPSGTPSSGPEVTPTEKAPTLTSGPNSFSPSVIAPPAPTALPGNVVTGQ
jgi:hypothetical protein